MTARVPVVTGVLIAALAAASCGSSSSQSSSPTAPSAPTANAKLAVSQTSYPFPNTFVGQVSTSSSIDVSATGSGSVVISNVTSSNASEFALVNAATCIGTSLSGGAPATCHLTVKFQPTAAGVRSSQLNIISSDGTSVGVAVFGTALSTSSDASGGSGGGGGDAGGSGGGSGGSGGSSGGSGGTSNGGGSFPQPPCVPNFTSSISLSIVNTTSFTILVTADGPTHESASIPSSVVQVIPIQAGNYTLNGQVPGSTNISFVPSTWTMVVGCDYLLNVVAKPLGQFVMTVR